MRKFKEKLLERINKIVTLTKTSRGNELYCKNRDAIIALLHDHPYFVENLFSLRDKYRLPKEGFASEQEAFIWENKASTTRQKIIEDVESLILEFNFNVLYRSDIKTYSYELVVCPSRARKWSRDKIPAITIFDADSDRKINAEIITPNGRYIQVFEWTTIKDIEHNWSKIKNEMDSSAMQSKSTNALYRSLWLLKRSGKDQREIQQIFRDSEDYKKLALKESSGILDMSRISLYASRYEKQLTRLKDFW